MNKQHNASRTTGACLCGAVCYEIIGNLPDVVNCHCSKCRRFHGNFGAYTRVLEKNLNFVKKEGLKWFHSINDETSDVYRGFCFKCGSSLFWHPKGRENISVAVGSLDDPTHLKTRGHIWLSQVSDYYSIDDALPKYQKRWDD